MFKIIAFGSVAAVSLLASVAPGQARQISVWGNTFSVDDGPALVQPAPITPRFNATVAKPERFMRHHRRLDDLN